MKKEWAKNGTMVKKRHFSPSFGNFSISSDIPLASPFEKGGLRGIFLMLPVLIEKLPRMTVSVKTVW